MKAKDVLIQVGNPNELTWRQHFLPYSCMKLFTQSNGKIWVCSKVTGKSNFRKLARYESAVVAARAWTQQIENTISCRIETKFFSIQKGLIAGKRLLLPDDHKIISHYLALWRARYLHRNHDFENISLIGVPQSDLSDDQREKLESQHCSASGHYSTLESNSINLMRTYDAHRLDLEGIVWSVYEVTNGMEVLLPDSSDIPYVHVSPTIFLFPSYLPINVNDYQEISSLNIQLIVGCGESFYCRNVHHLVRY